MSYLFVLVRKDLSASQIAVQASHAAIEAARRFIPPSRDHPHLALCSVKSEQALKTAIQRLNFAGIGHVVWTEPDMGDQVTAIAAEPLLANDPRRAVTLRFNLWDGKSLNRE